MSARKDDLPAGRRLDAAVHQRVFGAQLPSPDEEPEELPYYSTDLVASFQVLTFLKAQGYLVEVDTWTGGAAVVRLKALVEEEQSFVGATPAEAACRAALAVVAQR